MDESKRYETWTRDKKDIEMGNTLDFLRSLMNYEKAEALKKLGLR